MSFRIHKEGPQGPQGLRGPTGPEGVFKNIITTDLLPANSDISIGSSENPLNSIYLSQNLMLGSLTLQDLINRIQVLEEEVNKLNEIIQPYA